MKRFACSRYRASLLLLLGVLPPWSWAEEPWPVPDEHDMRELEGQFEDKPWLEQEVVIPAYPQKGNLLKIRSLPPEPQFEYWVDEQSLSVEKDGVVRYSLVITAKSGGASNALFEGIRCATDEYKTYAYGGGSGPLRPARHPRWMPIRSDPSHPARQDLKKFYFCIESQGRPKPINEILSALRYGPRDAEVQGFLY